MVMARSGPGRHVFVGTRFGGSWRPASSAVLAAMMSLLAAGDVVDGVVTGAMAKSGLLLAVLILMIGILLAVRLFPCGIYVRGDQVLVRNVLSSHLLQAADVRQVHEDTYLVVVAFRFTDCMSLEMRDGRRIKCPMAPPGFSGGNRWSLQQALYIARDAARD
jgi:hypothetical protein